MSKLFSNSDAGTITGQTFTGIDDGTPISTLSICFPDTLTNTTPIHLINCTFKGVVQFGNYATAAGRADYRNAASKPATRMNVILEDCHFDSTIVGGMSGVEFRGGDSIVGFDTGTTTSATNNTLTANGNTWGTWKRDCQITITGGTGAGQTRQISSHTLHAITISENWTVNPTAGSTFRIDTVRMFPHQQIGGAVAITGDDNIFDGLNLKAQVGIYSVNNAIKGSSGCATMFKFYDGRNAVTWSPKGNIVRNCYFEGWSEEALGFDSMDPTTSVATGTVSSTVGLTDVIVSNTTNMAVGMVFAVITGQGAGNYYRITARNGNQLTLDTSRFGNVMLQSGDRYTISGGMLDTLYDNNELHCNGRTPIANDGTRDYGPLGIGNNVAFSLWGNCHGNTVQNNLIVFDGQVDLAAAAFHEISTTMVGSPSTWMNPNSHNKYRYNTVRDDRVNPIANCVSFLAATICWIPGTETIVPPADYGVPLLGHMTEIVHNKLAGISRSQDYASVGWGDNTDENDDPLPMSTIYDAYAPYDFHNTYAFWQDYYPPWSNDPLDYLDGEWVPSLQYFAEGPTYGYDSGYIFYSLPYGQSSDTDIYDPLNVQFDIASGIINPPLTKEHTLDGRVKAIYTKTYGTDAVISARTTLTYSIDGVVKETRTFQNTLAGYTAARTTKTYSIDSMVRDTKTKTYEIDSDEITSRITKTHSLDIIIQNPQVLKTFGIMGFVNTLPPQRLLSTGFESYQALAEFQQIGYGDIDNYTPRSGQYEYAVNTVNSVGSIRKQLSTVDITENGFIRFYFRIKSYPSANTQIFRLLSVGGSMVGGIKLTNTGRLTGKLANSNDAPGTSQILNLNQWYRVDYKQNCSNSTIVFAIDGVFIDEYTNNIPGYWARAELGVVNSCTTHLVFDDYSVDQISGYINDGSIYHKQMTINAIVQASYESIHDLDGETVERLTAPHDLDGTVLQTFTSVNSIDGLVQQDGNQTHSLDGIVFETVRKNIQISGIITEIKTKTHTIDAVVRMTSTSGFTLNGIVKVITTNSHILDGIVLDRKAYSYQISAGVKAITDSMTTIDAIIAARLERQYTIATDVADQRQNSSLSVMASVKDTITNKSAVIIDGVGEETYIEGNDAQIRTTLAPMLGNTFTGNGTIAKYASFYLYRSSGASEDMFAEIYELVDGSPDGEPIAISEPLNASILSNGVHSGMTRFTFAEPILLGDETEYAVTVKYDHGMIDSIYAGFAVYPGRSALSYDDTFTQDWVVVPGYTLIFSVNGEQEGTQLDGIIQGSNDSTHTLDGLTKAIYTSVNMVDGILQASQISFHSLDGSIKSQTALPYQLSGNTTGQESVTMEIECPAITNQWTKQNSVEAIVSAQPIRYSFIDGDIAERVSKTISIDTILAQKKTTSFSITGAVVNQISSRVKPYAKVIRRL